MKNIFWIWIPVIFIVVSFQSCREEEIVIKNIPEFEAYLQEEMEDQNIPAMSVLIFRENQVLYENYMGKSQVEQNIPLASDHPFLLASVSKVVTAIALLQLKEDGQFSLDDPINNYLPFHVSVPDETTPITFRMLLTHTSGIADGSALDDQYYFGIDSPVALDYFMENYLVPGGVFYNETENFYDFEPGTEHEYSNEGSALIAVLVEQISGKDFNSYCKENIFQPLGMTHTFWRLDEAFEANTTIVQPYSFENGQYEPIQHYTFTDYPNGGLRSTARDMFTLLSAFVQSGTANNHQLLKSGSINDMMTPQIPSIDNEVGLHFFLMNAEHNLWGHDGGEEGVSTIMAINSTTKVGAIIFTNQGDADLDEVLVQSYQLGLLL